MKPETGEKNVKKKNATATTRLQPLVAWLREMAAGPMSLNSQHTRTCDRLRKAAHLLEVSRRKINDAELAAWARRHDLSQSMYELRQVAEDIRSL